MSITNNTHPTQKTQYLVSKIPQNIQSAITENKKAYQEGNAFAKQNPNATEADAHKEFDKWYNLKTAFQAGQAFVEHNPNATEAQKQEHQELTTSYLMQKHLKEQDKTYSI